jgi:hypothetical protein
MIHACRLHMSIPEPEMRSATVREMSMEPTSAGDTPASAAQPTLDALYLVNCLAIGGSERKVVRLVNRLWSRGVRAGIA